MTYFKSLKQLALVACSILAFASCKKVADVEPLGDGGQKIISIADYGGNFSSTNLSVDHTLTSTVIPLKLLFSTGTVSATDITVTVGVDAAALTAYNATITDPTKQYGLLPATAYTFPDKTVTIKAGQTVSEAFSIEFNPSMIDPAVNLMLPISIKSISGAPADVKKAIGTGTALFHFIGNPLAGNYTVTGGRYNCSAVGDQNWAPPAAIPANFAFAAIPSPKALAAVNATVTTVYVANLGAGTARDYFFTIDPAVSGDITVDLTASFLSGISNVRWFKKTYDKTTKTIDLVWSYNNLGGGTGNDRIILEKFTKL